MKIKKTPKKYIKLLMNTTYVPVIEEKANGCGFGSVDNTMNGYKPKYWVFAMAFLRMPP